MQQSSDDSDASDCTEDLCKGALQPLHSMTLGIRMSASSEITSSKPASMLFFDDQNIDVCPDKPAS